MYFYLKEPKSQKDTLIYLIYYINSKERNFKYSTKQSINPENWDFNNRLPKLKRGKKGVDNSHINSILNKYLDFLDKCIKDHEKSLKPLTKDKLKELFNNKFRKAAIVKETKTISLSSGVSEFISKKNLSKGQSKSWNEKYNNLMNKLILFESYKGKTYKFSDINDDWIGEYCGFLRTFGSFPKNSPVFKTARELKIKIPKTPYNDNTLSRHINFLFTYLEWCNGKYYNFEKLKNPVKDFVPDKVYLTDEDIIKLEEVKLSRDSLKKVRDLFLIGVYSGQRFSDYSVFEKADVKNGLIVKKSEKMEDDSFIPLHPKLKRLLDKYDWKLPSISGQKFNPHLKEICREAKILEEVKTINYIGKEKIIMYHQKCDQVESHTARRTFITLSSEKGMPDHIIMKITGIKDPATLLKYKKTSQEAVKESMFKIWS